MEDKQIDTDLSGIMMRLDHVERQLGITPPPELDGKPLVGQQIMDFIVQRLQNIEAHLMGVAEPIGSVVPGQLLVGCTTPPPFPSEIRVVHAFDTTTVVELVNALRKLEER